MTRGHIATAKRRTCTVEIVFSVVKCTQMQANQFVPIWLQAINNLLHCDCLWLLLIDRVWKCMDHGIYVWCILFMIPKSMGKGSSFGQNQDHKGLAFYDCTTPFLSLSTSSANISPNLALLTGTSTVCSTHCMCPSHTCVMYGVSFMR